MAERGLSLVHTTIMRWVHHYPILFIALFCRANDGY
jgi:transposase-like protein